MQWCCDQILMLNKRLALLFDLLTILSLKSEMGSITKDILISESTELKFNLSNKHKKNYLILYNL